MKKPDSNVEALLSISAIYITIVGIYWLIWADDSAPVFLSQLVNKWWVWSVIHFAYPALLILLIIIVNFGLIVSKFLEVVAWISLLYKGTKILLKRINKRSN